MHKLKSSPNLKPRKNKNLKYDQQQAKTAKVNASNAITDFPNPSINYKELVLRKFKSAKNENLTSHALTPNEQSRDSMKDEFPESDQQKVLSYVEKQKLDHQRFLQRKKAQLMKEKFK